MAEYEVGTFVRHRKKGDDWGNGIVVAVEQDRFHVRFENDDGRERRFPTSRAPNLLDVVAPESVPESSPLRALRKPAEGKGKTKTATGVKCAACGGQLNRTRYSTDGRWKSCPRCSSLQGTAHLYRRYPDDFGTTNERVTDDNPDGIQSYCQECRQKGEPSLTGTHTRLCSDLATQGRKP